MAGQNYPWLVGGDFNTIVDETEKLGDFPVTQSETHDFIQCVNSCALTELRYMGSTYIWWNGRIEEDCIFKRLDRVFDFKKLVEESWKIQDVIKENEVQFELAPTETNRVELSRVNAELKKLLRIEEDFWKEKAGLRWFKDGDRNTKFFHGYVKGRRRKLTIKEIKTMQGDIISNPQNISDEAVNVFRE
ncbi:hypothetical protein KY290_015692 [Solanum tuberosum]|uniref:Uncharacterized protein n=1 Tax=Solanum tuberosum TaxID=4113 RepID=A0ABQ7VT78_SOLTU|nr:hypothetical protein KY284_015018 [Solanum tuberosum]KAH0771711.1 hypothetical protein KY290_015692 [Solanum tuberosum]